MAFSRKQKWWLATACVLMLVILFVAISLSAKDRRTVAIDARFSGFKTNAAGARSAVFNVTNNCSFPIERAWYESIDVKTPTGWHTYTNLHDVHRGWGPALHPGQMETAEMPVPGVTNEWRVIFVYSEHLEPLERFTRGIANTLRKAGLPVKSGTHAYGFPSDSVSP